MWRQIRLGDPEAAVFIMGQSPSSSSYNTNSLGLPFYQGKADFGLRSPTPRVWCDAPVRMAESGDTLVSVRAPVGDVNLASERCALGRGLVAIRAGRALDPRFLYFALTSAKPQLAAVSTGSTFQSVNRSALEGVIIPCPSRDEQHSIATILEIVQCGVEIEEGVLAGTRELKQAAMRQLFSQIRGDDEALFAEPEPASEPWPIFTLGGLGSIGNGSTPKRTNSAYWDNGTIPWLTSGKIHEQLIAHADELVTELAARECHLPLVPAGSVLVAITGQGKTLGNVAQVLFDTCVSQHLAFVKFTRSDVLPGFVRHVLSSRYERLREIGSTGGTTKGALTCADLRAFPVPLPPFEQQKEIAGSLDAIDQSIQLHARRMHLFQELFRTLLRDLMSGRIRVADLDLSALDEEAA